MSTADVSLNELRTIHILADMPDHVLTWFAEKGQLLTFEPGARLFETDAPANEMVLLLEGDFDVRGLAGGQMTTYWTAQQGTVSGLLPYSRMKNYAGEGVANVPVRVLSVHRSLFQELIQLDTELAARLVALLADRIRETTRWVEQRDKLTALGKLSAGLAHELNNPAAAVVRAASGLRTRLTTLTAATTDVALCDLSREHVETLQKMRQTVMARHAVEGLSPVQRGRLEDEISDWLEAQGVEQPWVLAETFVDAGVTAADLVAGFGTMPKEFYKEVLGWLEAVLAADRLLGEIVSASSRISELIASIKAYSHMDRNVERQLTDVREGLDNTLVMLGHQIKSKVVVVERAYDAQLPLVPAYPGELNQVWTNLLDNAIDALPNTGGRLRVEAARERNEVVVKIIDNGSGIPEAIQGRIFEPFFTTKAIGLGTGLGLDIVHRVVTLQHGGRVEVESEPGNTVFMVRLPIDVESVPPPPGPSNGQVSGVKVAPRSPSTHPVK